MGLFHKRLSEASELLNGLDKDEPELQLKLAENILLGHVREVSNMQAKSISHLAKALDDYKQQIQRAVQSVEYLSKVIPERRRKNLALFSGEHSQVDYHVAEAKSAIEAAKQSLDEIKATMKELLKEDIRLE